MLLRLVFTNSPLTDLSSDEDEGPARKRRRGDSSLESPIRARPLGSNGAGLVKPSTVTKSSFSKKAKPGSDFLALIQERKNKRALESTLAARSPPLSTTPEPPSPIVDDLLPTVEENPFDEDLDMLHDHYVPYKFWDEVGSCEVKVFHCFMFD